MNLEMNCKTGTIQHVSNFYEEQKLMESVKIPTEGIVLPDRIGHWYMVDVERIVFSTDDTIMFYYIALLEHQTYGDMAGMILAFYDYYHSEWVELTETWDDILTTAEEMCLI